MSTFYYQSAQTFTASAGPFTTRTQAYANKSNSASLLLCFVCWGPVTGPVGNTITGVTDNASGGSNTWSSLTQISNGTFEYCQMWYCLSSKATASPITVTVSWTGTGCSFPQLIVMEYANTGGTILHLDQQAQATGTGTALDSGAVPTLAQTGELAICYGGNYAQLNFTAGTGSGWVARTTLGSVVGAVEEQFPANTTMNHGLWTCSASNPWLCGVATFSSTQLTAGSPQQIFC